MGQSPIDSLPAADDTLGNANQTNDAMKTFSMIALLALFALPAQAQTFDLDDGRPLYCMPGFSDCVMECFRDYSGVLYEWCVYACMHDYCWEPDAPSAPVALEVKGKPLVSLRPALAALRPDCSEETSAQMRLECRLCHRVGGEWSEFHNVCYDGPVAD